MFCFIPAKRASTRLKEKNILKINNVELVGHVIHSIQRSEIAEEIVISSEDDEVLEIGRKHGATFLNKRPEYLASDPYGVVDVLLYFLEKEEQFLEYEAVCIALPTTPLVAPEDFKGCLDFYMRHAFDCVMSVNENEHSSYQSILIKEMGEMGYLFPDLMTKKSQELEKTYYINGAVCIIKLDALLKYRSYFIPRIGSYVMPRNRSIDIDTEEDFNYARFLMETKTR